MGILYAYKIISKITVSTKLLTIHDSIKYNNSDFQRNFETKITIPVLIASVNIYLPHACSLRPDFRLKEQHGHLKPY